MTHDVELLWFADCAIHPSARRMLEEVIAEVAPKTAIHDVDATDPAVAERVRFPGSPTIRVNGQDVDPTYTDRATTPRAVGYVEPAPAFAACQSEHGSRKRCASTAPPFDIRGGKRRSRRRSLPSRRRASEVTDDPGLGTAGVWADLRRNGVERDGGWRLTHQRITIMRLTSPGMCA